MKHIDKYLDEINFVRRVSDNVKEINSSPNCADFNRQCHFWFNLIQDFYKKVLEDHFNDVRELKEKCIKLSDSLAAVCKESYDTLYDLGEKPEFDDE
jgi:hypothetical protein